MDEIQVVYHIFALNRQCSGTHLQMQHLLQTQLQHQQHCTLLALHCEPKKSTFLFFKQLSQKLTDFNDFWCIVKS